MNYATKYFPVTILDNFYDDPDLVRSYALQQEFTKSDDGRWPGERTECLSKINEGLFNNFHRRVLSLFYDFSQINLTWQSYACFQKITKFSENPESYKNKGWIHCDHAILSGVVFLNPNPVENSGLSIYRLNNSFSGVFDLEKELVRDEKFILHQNGDVNEEDYKKSIKSVNDNFHETMKIENIYNRLVLFSGSNFHGVPTFNYDHSEPRLSQVFFIKNLYSDNSSLRETYPVSRLRMGLN